LPLPTGVRWGPAAGDPDQEAAQFDETRATFHALEHSPAVSRVHDANAHHKFTGVARLVAILLQLNQMISTFAALQLLTSACLAFACHLYP